MKRPICLSTGFLWQTLISTILYYVFSVIKIHFHANVFQFAVFGWKLPEYTWQMAKLFLCNFWFKFVFSLIFSLHHWKRHQHFKRKLIAFLWISNFCNCKIFYVPNFLENGINFYRKIHGTISEYWETQSEMRIRRKKIKLQKRSKTMFDCLEEQKSQNWTTHSLTYALCSGTNVTQRLNSIKTLEINSSLRMVQKFSKSTWKMCAHFRLILSWFLYKIGSSLVDECNSAEIVH